MGSDRRAASRARPWHDGRREMRSDVQTRVGRSRPTARRPRLVVAAIAAIAVGLAVIAPASAGSEDIESNYVAELREVAKEVEAALEAAKTLSGQSSQLTWALQSAEVNPSGDAPNAGWENVTASNGQIQVEVTAEPQASFTGSWDTPPQQATGGTEFTMNVSVSGAITSGTKQGFRNLDLIEIINGRWTNGAVGAGVNCFDPIGAEPLSCTGPSTNEGTFSFAFPSFGDTYTFGVGALNCGGSCFVKYTYTAQTKEATQKAVAQRLGQAIARAKAMLTTYQRADTRHGTSEEHRLVDQIVSQLASAGRLLGKSTDMPVRTTPRQKKLAQKLLRQVKREAAAAAAERWPGLDKVESLLKNPRAFDRLVKREAIQRFQQIIERNKGRIVKKALRGVPIQIGVPLRTQVRWAAEDFLLGKVGPGLLKFDPRGLLLQFFGQQIRVAIKDIALAARPTGKVERRTTITLRGFQKHLERLEQLRGSGESSLGDVRAAVYGASGAHDAARHLRRDLAALVKRRCKNAPNSDRCEGAQTTRARLIAADKRLARAIDETTSVFLLRRAFDPAELRSRVKALCALEGSIKRIDAKLA